MLVLLICACVTSRWICVKLNTFLFDLICTIWLKVVVTCTPISGTTCFACPDWKASRITISFNFTIQIKRIKVMVKVKRNNFRDLVCVTSWKTISPVWPYLFLYFTELSHGSVRGPNPARGLHVWHPCISVYTFFRFVTLFVDTMDGNEMKKLVGLSPPVPPHSKWGGRTQHNTTARWLTRTNQAIDLGAYNHLGYYPVANCFAHLPCTTNQDWNCESDMLATIPSSCSWFNTQKYIGESQSTKQKTPEKTTPQ